MSLRCVLFRRLHLVGDSVDLGGLCGPRVVRIRHVSGLPFFVCVYSAEVAAIRLLCLPLQLYSDVTRSQEEAAAAAVPRASQTVPESDRCERHYRRLVQARMQ